MIAAPAAGQTRVAPDELACVLRRLRRSQAALAARSLERRLEALQRIVEAWLAPGSAWFARAETLLPAATGLSPEMVRYALPTMFEPLRGAALDTLLAAEASTRSGPPLIVHILPGNLPGMAAIPAVLSLAIGSAALLKPGRGDRVLPPLFADSIAALDAELGECVAAAYWPGGERACEDIALHDADLVVASGSDAALADLGARTRGRFIGHGERISFALVTREVVTDRVAAAAAASDLASDVACWDQRGCLSPQLCFVEGDRASAEVLAAHVADALTPLASSLPPAQMREEERLAIRRFRDEAEWRELGGEGGAWFAHEQLGGGTVVVEPLPSFRPTPLCRSLRVMPVADLAELRTVLAPARRLLEGAGIRASAERRSALVADLESAGVHRVCEIGSLQRPPLDWRQGGRPRLGDWLAG